MTQRQRDLQNKTMYYLLPLLHILTEKKIKKIFFPL